MSKTVHENVNYPHAAAKTFFSSEKLGIGLYNSRYKTNYLRKKSKLCFLYSSIEYMFAKPNLKRVKTSTEPLLN